METACIIKESRFYRYLCRKCPFIFIWYVQNENENVFNTSKKLLKNRNPTFPIVHYATQKIELVPDTL